VGYAPESERAAIAVHRPHLRGNQISAVSNHQAVGFTTYDWALTAAVFLTFPARLVQGAGWEIFLNADDTRVRAGLGGGDVGAAQRDRLEVFYLPTYAPQLTPAEYQNNDPKGSVNATATPDTRDELRDRIVAFMDRLSALPCHVRYFLHPGGEYAAPVRL
jgi:hypothetical protein